MSIKLSAQVTLCVCVYVFLKRESIFPFCRTEVRAEVKAAVAVNCLYSCNKEVKNTEAKTPLLEALEVE